MENTKDSSYFASAPIGKLIAKFAVPCVISLLVNSLYNIVDQIFIGQGVGYLGNGATTVIFPITVIALAFAQCIGDGGAAFLSLKLGEKEKEKAGKGVGNALIMLVASSIILLVLCLVFLQPLARLFGSTDAIMPYAMDYGVIISIGLPFMIISTGINSIIRADGSPKFAMVSMLLGAVINTILDPIFIFPLKMGVTGAALATIIGQIASCLVCVWYLRKMKSVKLTRHSFKIHVKTSRSVLSLGLSSFITQISIVVAIIACNNMLTAYGSKSVYGAEIPLTVLGIVMKVYQVLISVLIGIAAGSQPIVGYNYGAGNLKRVKKAFVIALAAGFVISIIAFFLFEFCPLQIISIFGSEDGLYNEFAVKCFRIFLMFCILTSFQTISAIFLQSIGKPIKSAVVSLSRQIMFLVPAVLILPIFLGLEGVLWAGPVADGLAFILAVILTAFQMRSLKEDKPLPVSALAPEADAS